MFYESKMLQKSLTTTGTFGYRGDDEYVYTSGTGRCQESDDPHGGTGTGTKRSGQDRRQEANEAEYVQSSLTSSRRLGETLGVFLYGGVVV